MARKQLSLEDVLNYVETLPYTQFKNVVEHYSQKQSSDFSNTLNQLIVSNFEQRLERLEVNTTCPSCASKAVVKNGKRHSASSAYKAIGNAVPPILAWHIARAVIYSLHNLENH